MKRESGFELNLSRHVRAPRAKVFEAFTRAEAMKQWMCPRGMTIPKLDQDLRVGGGFRLTMRSRDGEEFTAVAKYREVTPPERLVYTWQWEGGPMPAIETLITVTFVERDGGTEVRMNHAGFPDEAMCESHKEGWGSCLNRLVDTHDPRGTAASVALLGDARSTYTRTARIALAEKGVAYAMETATPHTPPILELHPFGRVPAFRDGDVRLFETSAIVRYVEEAFPGPTLLPQNIRDRAIGEQWVSAVNSYFYDCAARRYILQYVFPRGKDGQPERAVIDPAVKELEGLLAAFERGYARPFLAGQNPTMADYFLAPIVGYLQRFPESKALLAKCPKLMRAQGAIEARDSWKATEPR